MAGAARKLNNLPKCSLSYWRIPYSAVRIRVSRKDGEGNQLITADGEPVMRGLTFNELKMIGEVYSFSHIKDKPAAVCERSYSEYQKLLTNARCTVGNSVKTLKENKIIRQVKHYHKKAEYTCEGFAETEFYITIEKYLTEQEFYIPRKDRARKLTDLEVFLISLLGSLCNMPYAKGCERSIQELSEELGRCEEEIREALRNLISAGFLSCRGRIYRVFHKRRLKFDVNPEVLRLMKHKPRKAPKQKGGLTEQELAADQRTDRERHYAKIRQNALKRQNYYLDLANADREYAAIEQELRRMPIEQAKAETRGLSVLLSGLKQREAELHMQRVQALIRLNIDESDLKPKYTCTKCDDTGWNKKTGKLCDCYNPPGVER